MGKLLLFVEKNFQAFFVQHCHNVVVTLDLKDSARLPGLVYSICTRGKLKILKFISPKSICQSSSCRFRFCLNSFRLEFFFPGKNQLNCVLEENFQSLVTKEFRPARPGGGKRARTQNKHTSKQQQEKSMKYLIHYIFCSFS